MVIPHFRFSALDQTSVILKIKDVHEAFVTGRRKNKSSNCTRQWFKGSFISHHIQSQLCKNLIRYIEINGSTECMYFAHPPGTVCRVRTDIILSESTGQYLNKIKCKDPIIHQWHSGTTLTKPCHVKDLESFAPAYIMFSWIKKTSCNKKTIFNS
jgi:hypothetical protein